MGPHGDPGVHAALVPNKPAAVPAGDLYGDLSRRGGYMTESHVGKAVLLPFLSALSYLHSHVGAASSWRRPCE